MLALNISYIPFFVFLIAFNSIRVPPYPPTPFQIKGLMFCLERYQTMLQLLLLLLEPPNASVLQLIPSAAAASDTT